MRVVPKLLIGLALLVSGNALAIDFKGIMLGQPLQFVQERSVFGTLDCNPNQMSPEEYQGYVQDLQEIFPGVRRVCLGETSIATVPANVTILLGASRRVLHMTFQFDGEHYSQVTDAISEKWGDGTEDTSDEDEPSVWWVFDDGTSISVHRAGSHPSTVGLVEYTLQDTTPSGDL